MDEKALVVGTRGSALALKQAQITLDALKSACTEMRFALKTIRTQGDREQDKPLSRFSSTGVFVKELESALLRGEIDLAVHSLKDLPTELPKGLTLGAFIEREDARDVLVSRGNITLADLPRGATVGSGCPRRTAQLKAIRPDLEMKEIRGNVDTRIRKLVAGEYDGVVLAAAGLLRMGWADRIAEYLPYDICLPAAGQGAIAVEVRSNAIEVAGIVARIDHYNTRQAVTAERLFLSHLGGGCQVPISSYGQIRDGVLLLKGVMASQNGERLLRAEVEGDQEDPEGIAKELAERLLAMGAQEILRG
ncbi:MAG: hydroxymethylbilane synthase [Chloroflexi bacterium]|nr:hydroxymethylbilane synthase [Chloroflexota bacterium]